MTHPSLTSLFFVIISCVFWCAFQLSTSGDLRGTITLSADLGEGPLGSGLSFVSPANLAHNSSHIYAMYQSKRLRTVASVDERFLLGSEAAFINTPSKFASFGSRRLSALASRRLFTSDVEEFGGEPSETEHATALATAQALPPVPQSPERPPSLPHTFVPSTAVVASPFRAPSRNSGFRPPPSTPLPFVSPVSLLRDVCGFEGFALALFSDSKLPSQQLLSASAG